MIKNTNINNINIVTDAGYIIIVVGQYIVYPVLQDAY